MTLISPQSIRTDSTVHPLSRGIHQVTQQIGNLLRLAKAADASFLRELLDRLFHGEIVGGCPLLKDITKLHTTSHIAVAPFL
jgi:hypothetical protein